GMKTIESFTLPEDRNIFSQVMESHQKNGTANGKILGYIADYFLYPKSLSDLAYISQVLQLKAIQYGVEHWRRNRGRCMGSLYWQLNDSWPVASWASIDYYGRWKALHYGARRFYAPVMVSACEEEELSARIRYYVNNDTLEPINGTVEAALIDRDFQILWTDARQVTAEPMSVSQCMEADYGNWIPSEEKRAEVFARVRLTIGGKCISEQTTLFVKPKHFHYRKPQYQVQVREMENTFEICTKCQTFAQYVELDLRKLDGTFSDNYFDITSPEGVTVVLPKAELRNVAGSFGGEGVHPELVSCEALQEQIRVRSVADSYTTG
ncbi:MAG: glycoside hydrolase family 2 protein, partial [Lachnospiraceae bacterium]|nr:glycoside hydrolase family 2 protein [Lachnospiraceae bacterium]